MTSRKPFLGAWSLEAWTVTEPDKPVRYPYGPSPKGFILYSPEGIMSATLMKNERPGLDTSRPGMTAKIAESVKLMREQNRFTPFSSAYYLASVQYMNYCGRYSVTDQTIIHHVDAALIPDWIGTDLVRTYAFKRDRLVLTGKENGLLDQLVWKRVPPLSTLTGEQP